LNTGRSGWESAHLISATVLLPAASYPDPERITAFHRLVVERVESLPGVASASISSFTPFFNWPDARKFLVEGREPPQRGQEPAAVVNAISPRYFATFETRLLAGRAFDDRDVLGAAKVFIVSEAMAKGMFANENPIGRRIARAGAGAPQWGEIVGVAADVKSVLPDPVRVIYQLYQPMAQEPRALSEIAVLTTGAAPATLVAGIRAVMTNLDPDLPVRGLQSADATIHRANYQLGVLRDMLTGFAVLGLGLAALGIYGVIARTMTQRTGEFAIRLALGATARNITRMVLGSGVKLALAGSVVGLLGAVGLSRLLIAGYPGMQFNSGPVMALATAFLVTIALFACYLPARHAARISAVDALRSDE
jgi:predicted permease